MTITPKPGNQPDPNDMADPKKDGGDASNPPTTEAELANEEEAARLGDFA
jgi:hypothetical protein